MIFPSPPVISRMHSSLIFVQVVADMLCRPSQRARNRQSCEQRKESRDKHLGSSECEEEKESSERQQTKAEERKKNSDRGIQMSRPETAEAKCAEKSSRASEPRMPLHLSTEQNFSLRPREFSDSKIPHPTSGSSAMTAVRRKAGTGHLFLALQTSWPDDGLSRHLPPIEHQGRGR